MITRLVYGETEFLLTGDASKEIERKVTSVFPEKIKSDVLKAGHHGSQTSTDEHFLKSVNPEYVVISAFSIEPKLLNNSTSHSPFPEKTFNEYTYYPYERKVQTLDFYLTGGVIT